MAEQLCSVGLDVGTTTTQLIVSELRLENRATGFAVPEMEITSREIRYKSPVYFTPLLEENRVDEGKIREIVVQEYQNAGITREAVDTGAIIITGETSRKENARAVLGALSDLAGEFVVATAGPELESVLAAKGAGAVTHSAETGQRVLHFDIGGGTSNYCLIEMGRITATGCLNVGGRLIKFDGAGRIIYVSPVLEKLCKLKSGESITLDRATRVGELLTQALEMAAGLRPQTRLLEDLTTREMGRVLAVPPGEALTVSFSGGVADCIEGDLDWRKFGDLGPVLGRCIRKSLLCRGAYRLGRETIRATVIGAGCHSTQLSGSTVYYRDVEFPIKNLSVVTDPGALAALDGPGVLAISGWTPENYGAVCALADRLAALPGQVFVALEADAAKTLGHCLALRRPRGEPLLCIDRVRLKEGDYLDVGAPVGPAIPVVIKTLILNG